MRSIDLLAMSFLLLAAACGPSANDPEQGDPAAVKVLPSRKTARSDSTASAAHGSAPNGAPLCDVFAERADTLRRMYDKLSDRIDQMKYDLVASDADDASACGRVFTNGDAGRELFQAVKDYYARAERYGVDQPARASIHQFAATAFPYDSPEDWRKRSFSGVPRVAVVTMLSKTCADIGHAESLCLRPMLLKCVGKSSVLASGDIGEKRREAPAPKPKNEKSKKHDESDED